LPVTRSNIAGAQYNTLQSVYSRAAPEVPNDAETAEVDVPALAAARGAAKAGLEGSTGRARCCLWTLLGLASPANAGPMLVSTSPLATTAANDTSSVRDRAVRVARTCKRATGTGMASSRRWRLD
jgi:hypothetical protein